MTCNSISVAMGAWFIWRPPIRVNDNVGSNSECFTWEMLIGEIERLYMGSHTKRDIPLSREAYYSPVSYTDYTCSCAAYELGGLSFPKRPSISEAAFHVEGRPLVFLRRSASSHDQEWGMQSGLKCLLSVLSYRLSYMSKLCSSEPHWLRHDEERRCTGSY